MESAHLRLPKISRLHMGDYLCVASNGIAPSTSKKYRIRVQCAYYILLNMLESMCVNCKSEQVDEESIKGRYGRFAFPVNKFLLKHFAFLSNASGIYPLTLLWV